MSKPGVITSVGRQTRPSNFNPYTSGNGLGLLARRGFIDRNVLTTKAALKRLGQNSPLQLLSYLPDLHPSAGLAIWNALRLTCVPGDLKIKAVSPDRLQDTDDDGTAAIANLFTSLPDEVGGLMGLQSSLTLQLMFTGLTCLEGVPGPRMTGLIDVWPVDALTVKMDRDPVTTRAIPWQRQIWPEGQTAEDYVDGYRRLSTETFFWRTIDAWPDDLYGRAPYAPALSELLADIAMMQDLRDSVHFNAWPRKGYGINFVELYKVAQALGHGDPNAAEAWVNARVEEAIERAQTIKADDDVVFDASGDLKVLEGSAGFAALKEILIYLRQRITQSLKSLPTLMGINDGSTQTYTSVEWAIYAAGLVTVQAIVAALLVKVATLHLRLLGLPLVAVAEYTPIRTTDELIEAQTLQMTLENLKEQVRMGWITNETACQTVRGVAPEAEPMPGAFDRNPTTAEKGLQDTGGGDPAGEKPPANQQQPDDGTN